MQSNTILQPPAAEVEPPSEQFAAERSAKALAEIIATGARRYLLRLRRSHSRHDDETPEIPRTGLEVSSETRLSESRRSGV